MPVLNAQLQAALSVGDYARSPATRPPRRWPTRMTAAAARSCRASTPATGPSTRSGVTIRRSTTMTTSSPCSASSATRTGDAALERGRRPVPDLREPSRRVIRVGAPPTLYPRPADGYRDEAPIRFWLSKRSTVTLPRREDQWSRRRSATARRPHRLTSSGAAEERAVDRARDVTALAAADRASALDRGWRGARRPCSAAGRGRRPRTRLAARGTQAPGRWHATCSLELGGCAASLGYLPDERCARARAAASRPARREPAPAGADPDVPRGQPRRPRTRRTRSCTCPRARFAAQVAWLAAHGYRAVTLQRVFDSWRGAAQLPAKPIVLSFDDGYLSQREERAAGPERAALAGRAQPRVSEPAAGVGDPAAGRPQAARRRLGARRAHAHAPRPDDASTPRSCATRSPARGRRSASASTCR